MKWRSGQARNSPLSAGTGCQHPAAAAIGPGLTWPGFWDVVQVKLRDRGYRRSSLIVVRQVLRSLAKTSGVGPGDLTRNHLDAHFRRLVSRRCSASWLAMNISILRTVFDRIWGCSLLQGRVGPKRPDRLPRILSRGEVESLRNAAEDFREALLLGLLAECGLKIGEACALRWGDVLLESGEIRVAGSGSTLARMVPIPMSLVGLLREGTRRFVPDAPLFPGRRSGRALSTRMAERLVRRCARRAGLPHHATSMVLRHSYAVLALETGVNIRELQSRLGHAGVETTMLYQRCLPPEETRSPLDVTDDTLIGAETEAAARRSPPATAIPNRPRGLLARLRDALRRASG